MPATPPVTIAIDHDDHHAEHVGRLPDGRQFFLTTPFVPAINGPGNEFVALFLFDAEGNLLEARIDEFGPRAVLDVQAQMNAYQGRIDELQGACFGRIVVKPFSLERFGITFGLIVRAPEEEDDIWWVELHPGNYMAFTEPWDSGEYDT